MRRKSTIVALASFGILIALVSGGKQPCLKPAAEASAITTWMWTSGAEPADVVARAAPFGITRMYVWVPPGFSRDAATLAWVESLVAAAGAQEIAVDALGGDPSWALYPSVARTWASEVADSGLFSRIHLDVEPHGDPDWERNRAKLSMGLLRSLEEVASAGLPVDADVPYWYVDVPGPYGESLFHDVIARADSVVIMAYDRPDATDTIRAATPQLMVSHASDIPAMVGINIRPSATEPTSFIPVSRPVS